MISTLLLCSGLIAAALSDGDRAAYAAAQAQAGRDAGAHVKLALWCEAHGLTAERAKHLALAVLNDPKHAMARGLMGLVQIDGAWRRPAEVEAKLKADAQRAAKFTEYAARRARTAHTADAQWKLALWCEENDLKGEETAHLWAVLRRDPTREAAWKRLGYKKRDGRWATDEQLAAERADAEGQKKADSYWRPLLTKWRGWLGDKHRRDEANRLLGAVVDPRAVPSVCAVFAAGRPAQQAVAVRVLGQIDAAASSRALGIMAVLTDAPEVRRGAIEVLKRRDPREYAGLLVQLLRETIRYEVRPVGGPGSPGGLFVKGKLFNVQRLYAPPPMPNIPVYPGEPVALDANGLPVVGRRAFNTASWITNYLASTTMSLAESAAYTASDPDVTTGPQAAAVQAQGLASFYNNMYFGTAQTGQAPNFSGPLLIRVGKIASEYQKSALSARQQLARDVALVDGYNGAIRESNERISRILNEATGQDRPADRQAWDEWWINTKGYAYISEPDAPALTVVENVPLPYSPEPVMPVASYTSNTGLLAVAKLMGIHPSCFAAGTLVHTLRGTQPIEALRVGDQVLAQDLKSGSLGYRPILVVHHNPPGKTFRVTLGGETIVSSEFHRFWKAGHGWVMARDLKPGDALRTLGGVVPVASIETGKVEPVFNLDVAEDADFFVGEGGALVHDNTLPDLRLAPFDAPPALAAVAAQ